MCLLKKLAKSWQKSTIKIDNRVSNQLSFGKQSIRHIQLRLLIQFQIQNEERFSTVPSANEEVLCIPFRLAPMKGRRVFRCFLWKLLIICECQGRKSQLKLITIKFSMNTTEYLPLQNTQSSRRVDSSLPVLNAHAELLFSKHWKWVQQSSVCFKGRVAAPNSSISPKQEILLWFQNLAPRDKIACTAIHNADFINSFLRLLPARTPNRLFHLPDERAATCQSGGSEEAFFDEILGQLRVAWLGQPVLYFSSADIIDLRMLDWLNNVTSFKIFESAQRGREGEENLLWFSKSSFHYLQSWLASQLEVSIVGNYFNRQQKGFYVDEFRQFLTKSGKNIDNYGLDMKLQVFNNKSANELAHLKNKIKQEQERFNELKQEKLIQNMEKVAQHKKRCNKRQKKKEAEKKRQSQPEKQKNNEQLKQEQLKNEEMSHIQPQKETITSIRQPFTILPLAQNTEGKQSPKITSPTRQQSSKDPKPAEKQHETTPIKKKEQKEKFSPAKRKPSASKNLIYVSPKRTRSPQHVRSSNLLEEGDIKQKYSEQDRQSSRIGEQSSQNNFSSVNMDPRDHLNKRRRRKCKKQSEQFRQARKTIWSRLITRQLDNLIDQLNIETNALSQFKIIAFERVRVFVQSLYPIASAVLFGSNAIGLSLPNSDVDILLCGLPCNLKEDASDFLAQIAVQINAMGWVVSCSTYLNAKVPIIKLEIDPSIPFLQTKRRQDLFRVYNPMALYYLDTSKCPAGRTIKVDITINLSGITSVGYESTLLMKDWITKMPQIQRIIILFKYILAIRNFNSNFNGGIGSYCLFAMIAAYFKNHPSNQEATLSTTFLQILKWYGEDFDNLSYVVWLRETGSCFVHEEQLEGCVEDGKRSLLRLMDPITHKMMNSSCNEYSDIKAEFRRIWTQLNDIQLSIDDYLKENDVTTAELTKIMQTKKGLEKLISRYENKHPSSVKVIIDRSN